jgi:ABC-type phosphate transport system auxiliary subunit
MLPPEIANDSDLKLQLADLAEKQMKMIVDYRKDIERLAKDKTQLEGKLEEQSTHQRSEGKSYH